jgi:hypothetical protein
VHADALEFLRGTTRQWSAIAVDVFHGTAIPEAVLTSDIGALLASRTALGGLIVWNVADSPQSSEVRRIVQVLQLEGLAPATVSVLDCDVGNTLVVCRNTPVRGGRGAAIAVDDDLRSAA